MNERPWPLQWAYCCNDEVVHGDAIACVGEDPDLNTAVVYEVEVGVVASLFRHRTDGDDVVQRGLPSSSVFRNIVGHYVVVGRKRQTELGGQPHAASPGQGHTWKSFATNERLIACGIQRLFSPNMIRRGATPGRQGLALRASLRLAGIVGHCKAGWSPCRPLLGSTAGPALAYPRRPPRATAAAGRLRSSRTGCTAAWPAARRRPVRCWWCRRCQRCRRQLGPPPRSWEHCCWSLAGEGVPVEGRPSAGGFRGVVGRTAFRDQCFDGVPGTA